MKWNGAQSEPFKLSNGVKQGAVISAPLFAIYINPLINDLQQSKKGCYIGNICANAFAYADDIVILTPSCNALRSLIKICEKYAESYKLRFNPDKCTLLIYAENNADFYSDNCNIMLCGKTIKNVKTEKHLGHVFTSTNHSHLINIDSVIRDLKVRTNTIINQFKPISWQSKVKLFISQCSSLYGCPLWRLDDNQVDDLVRTWNICCRRLLRIPPNTRTYVIPHIMKTMPIKHIIMYRILNFYISGLNHECSTISWLFKHVLITHSSYMLQNINTILNEFNIKYHDLFIMNKTKLKGIIDNKSDEPDWRSNLIIELLSIRKDQITCNLSPAEGAFHVTCVTFQTQNFNFNFKSRILYYLVTYNKPYKYIRMCIPSFF